MARHRRLLAVVIAVAALFGLWIAFMPHSADGVRDLADDAGPYAVIAFLVVWVVATASLVSGPLLAAAGGMLFGPLDGSVITVVGALLGAVAAFSIARRAGGNALGNFGGRTKRIVEALEKRGFRSMLVLRAAPAAPAAVVNYAAGMSRIKLRHFVLATAIAGTPRYIAYAVLGSNATDPSPLAVAAPVVVLVAMAIIGIVVAGATWKRGLTPSLRTRQ
jgi:uncharacterized membrane protein YdjX (TVP38/TMEM64 family)